MLEMFLRHAFHGHHISITQHHALGVLWLVWPVCSQLELSPRTQGQGEDPYVHQLSLEEALII